MRVNEREYLRHRSYQSVVSTDLRREERVRERERERER